MFRIVTAQLIESGGCRQVDIIRTFGVSKSSVVRSVNKLRRGGVEDFFKPRAARRGGTVFTPPTLEQAQSLLDEEYSRADVARKLGVQYDTLRKAIDDAAQKWRTHLSRHWMQVDPEAAGTLYIDGHVRVYHGKKTCLPLMAPFFKSSPCREPQ